MSRPSQKRRGELFEENKQIANEKIAILDLRRLTKQEWESTSKRNYGVQIHLDGSLETAKIRSVTEAEYCGGRGFEVRTSPAKINRNNIGGRKLEVLFTDGIQKEKGKKRTTFWATDRCSEAAAVKFSCRKSAKYWTLSSTGACLANQACKS